MAETKHSPEPWRSDPDCGAILDSNDNICAEAWQYGTDPEGTAEANERRIVAAVNACAGIPTAALESGALETALRRLDTVAMAAEEDASAHVSTRSLASQARAALRALGRLP